MDYQLTICLTMFNNSKKRNKTKQKKCFKQKNRFAVCIHLSGFQKLVSNQYNHYWCGDTAAATATATASISKLMDTINKYSFKVQEDISFWLFITLIHTNFFFILLLFLLFFLSYDTLINSAWKRITMITTMTVKVITVMQNRSSVRPHKD